MYSPKIKENLVRELFKLKHSTEKKRPMTQIVNEAVIQYLQRSKEQNERQSQKNS